MSASAEYKELLTGRWITDLANTSAYIYNELPDLNWAGFYLLEGDTLYLGPFQGKPACTEIKLGRGVCGTAAITRKTLVVPDVHEFAGHIACDEASRSEIVIPLIDNHSNLIGVLDVDSPKLGRFGNFEEKFLAHIIETLISASLKAR
jgi:L-methionine (R)-S-oxide reductase